ALGASRWCARSATRRIRRRRLGRCAPSSRAPLREPPPSRAVVEDDGALAGLEHDLEVAADDRLLGPPAVEDAPFLAHQRDLPVVDLPRRPVEARLDAGDPRLAQSSRGTSSARASGISAGEPMVPPRAPS